MEKTTEYRRFCTFLAAKNWEKFQSGVRHKCSSYSSVKLKSRQIALYKVKMLLLAVQNAESMGVREGKMRLDVYKRQVFTVLNIILIVTCVVLLLGRDRKAPVISFSENDLIYYSGIDNEKLLQGVAAMDAKNGDVSDRIVVEKIVQNKNEDRTVVYYAVTDLDGNAAKASRVFEAVNEATGDAMKDIGMAGFDGDMDGALPVSYTHLRTGL